MLNSRYRIPTGLALLIGVFAGWILAGFRSSPLQAAAADRSGEAIVASGPVLVRYDETAKGPLALDALYFLDYKAGRLLGTVPSYQQTNSSMRVLDTFTERDLVSDFKLDLDTGPRPRFLMTTGQLGPYTSGWAPLYVFETTTNQVAVYRMQVQLTIGKASRPTFDLIELRSYSKTGGPDPRP
jgi:hypothetical protein